MKIYINKKQKKILFRIIITLLMLLILHFISLPYVILLILHLIIYFVIGYDILKKAFKGILNQQIFDENFLMTLASIGSFILSIISKNNNYVEGISVLLFYQIGEFFQKLALNKSRNNISSLMDIKPDYANIIKNSEIKKVNPSNVSIGSEILIMAGEKIPIDGIIIDGNSYLDTSALTGESIPKNVNVGNFVNSGSINLNAPLKLKTTRKFEHSTVSKILDLVENASSHKSKTEAFITRFSKIYTPLICFFAFLLSILPPFINFILKLPLNLDIWIYRSLTFLVVSCPCALAISIPLSFFSSIGGASKEGILIKGSNYLESLCYSKYVIFDKTGTLTKGKFEVTKINSVKMENKKLLEYATIANFTSSHPISKSLKNCYKENVDINRIKDLNEIGGKGIIAKIDNDIVAVGNEKLMNDLNIKFESNTSFGTTIHIAINNNYEGNIIISDTIKENSLKTIIGLKKEEIKKIIMFTGDTKNISDKIASLLNIDEVYSELLPNDKVNKLTYYLSKNKNEKVIYVGDGINDAPCLTRADIGISMGHIGSDAAIEASDIVLMDDDPLKIVKAIKISKKCIRIIKENIVFSLTIKISCLILTAFGIATMKFAIFADVGVMIIAILNSIRTLNIKNKKL